MLPASGSNAMDVLRMLVPLVVFGSIGAKLVLDWAGGKRPFRGETDSFGDTSWGGGHDGGDGGWCGDGDSGGGDCGH